MPFSSADPNAFVAVGMQSALGTPQATAGKFRFAKYLSGTSADADITAVDLREGGDGLDFGFTYKQKQAVRGSLVMNARPEITGQLLSMALGGATWDAASGPANHVFHTGHASFPWSTILAQQPGSAMSYLISDGRYTGFTLDAVGGQPWKFTYPFIGINLGASMAALTPTYYGDDPWLYHSSPSYIVDGVADPHITEFHITAAYGVDESQTQSVLLDDIPVLNRDLNLTFTRRFEDPNLWQKVYFGASGNVIPTTAIATGSFRGAVSYGAGATLRTLDVNANLISYRTNTISGLDPDGKTVYQQVTAKILKGATYALFVKLANAHASAYAS